MLKIPRKLYQGLSLLNAIALCVTIAAASYAAENAARIKGNLLFDKDSSGNATGIVFSNGDTLTAAPKDGKTVLNGDGPPIKVIAQPGDFYIDTTNRMLYGPYVADWPAGVSLVGPAGVGFRWRGTFDSAGAEYEINDVTYYDGSSYIVVGKITNLCDTPGTCDKSEPFRWVRPGNPGELGWQLLAAQGLQGAKGATGATGAAGPTGPTGPQGSPGPGLASFDALRGLPCNVGTLYQGAVNISYSVAYVAAGVPEPNKNNISMECAYTGHNLTISAVAETTLVCGTYICNYYWTTCGSWPNEYQCQQPIYCDRFCGLPTVVHSQPAGININYNYNSENTSTDTWNYNLSAGTAITLTETNGGVFSGDCVGTGTCTMTMDGAKTVTVTR